MHFNMLNYEHNDPPKVAGDGDTMQLIYTEGMGKFGKTSKSATKKNLLCTLFLLFILLALFAMVYVVFQGMKQREGRKDFVKESHHLSKYIKTWSYRVTKIPPYQDKAATARFIVHNSDWAALSTISIHLKGYPYSTVTAVSDGLPNNSTGVPYLYVTRMDMATQDFLRNPQVSMVMTEAQSDICVMKHLDPFDPRCARVMLIGKMVVVSKEEKSSAEEIFFSKHPHLKDIPSFHHMFFVKLNISRVHVLDYFGGLSVVDPKDYFVAKF